MAIAPWVVPEELWELAEPLLPKRERRFRYPGRKRLPDREALQGILFVLHTGIAWRHLPLELGYGSGSTCYRRLDEWQRAGVWEKLHALLLAELRAAGELTGGNRNDITQLIALVDAVPAVGGCVGRPRRRPDRVTADRAYDHRPQRRELRKRGITAEIARRNTAHGSGLGRVRWVVERVAWRGEDLRVADEALERMAECRASFLALLESDPDLVVYGTMSRAGEGARFRLTREEMEEQGRRPHRHLAAAVAESAGGTELKEPMELINGSPCAAALVADAAVAARRRLALAHEVFALSAEAILAPTEAYGQPLEELWDDEHETAALRELRRNLHGRSADRRAFQAPVSYRILPRVLGQTHRAVARAERAAETSLRSVSDNPVYIPPDDEHPLGRAFSTGGYHNGMAYPALDDLAAAWADLAQLAERQVERLLAVIEQGSYGAVMGGFYMVAVGWAEDARTAAQPTFIPLGGLGQNDTAAPTFFAWRKEREAGFCLEGALAVLAALASDELARAGRGAPPALEEFLAAVRDRFPATGERWARGTDAARLHEAFTTRVFGSPEGRSATMPA